MSIKKFVPTKNDYFKSFLNNLVLVDEVVYKDKTRKIYYINKDMIIVDYYQNITLVYMEENLISKGFLDVTNNILFNDDNIAKIHNKTILEGTDGVGKTATIMELLKYGIICQDRSNDVISKNMLFTIPMDVRANIYERYLKEIDKKIIILVNNDKEELERRINKREKLEEFDDEAYRYNLLYQDTFLYMKERNMLYDKLYLADVTNLTLEEQVEKVKKIILNKG